MLHSENVYKREQEKSSISVFILAVIVCGCILIENFSNSYLPSENKNNINELSKFSLENAKSHLTALSSMEPRIAGMNGYHEFYFCFYIL